MINQKKNNFLDFSNCIVPPGYLAVCEDPAFVCVVCGNGMAVFLRDKIKRTGGVAHYIYPQRKPREKGTNYHADVAIHTLLKSMLKQRSYMSSLEAQLFGGGNLRGYAQKRAQQMLKDTRKILKRLNIPIVSEDVGGSIGRKLVINTYSGEVALLKTHNVRKTDWAPEYECQTS